MRGQEVVTSSGTFLVLEVTEEAKERSGTGTGEGTAAALAGSRRQL